MEQNIVTSGIEGLDQLLNGGLLKNRSVLVQGGPGTGKSTFGFQFLVNGIVKQEEPGILLCMEYEKQDIISDMEVFNWPVKELIMNNKLKIINPPGGLENPKKISIDEMINFLFEHVTEINAERLVIDSLDSLAVSLDMGHLDRRELIRFISLIRDLNCTTVLISENYEDKTDLVYSYATHGVINLYNFRQGSSRLRAIEILKMRGINHSNLTHSMNIKQNIGIQVLPHEIDIS